MYEMNHCMPMVDVAYPIRCVCVGGCVCVCVCVHHNLNTLDCHLLCFEVVHEQIMTIPHQSTTLLCTNHIRVCFSYICMHCTPTANRQTFVDVKSSHIYYAAL